MFVTSLTTLTHRSAKHVAGRKSDSMCLQSSLTQLPTVYLECFFCKPKKRVKNFQYCKLSKSVNIMHCQISDRLINCTPHFPRQRLSHLQEWECIQELLQCLHFVVAAFVLPSGTICCAHGTVPQTFILLNYTLSSPICQTCYIKLFINALYLASRHCCSPLHLHSTVYADACFSQQLFSIEILES